jgi:hypothetical protein
MISESRVNSSDVLVLVVTREERDLAISFPNSSSNVVIAGCSPEKQAFGL